jgi:hypothetical protein
MQESYQGTCPRLIELPNVEILYLNFHQINVLDELFAGMASEAENTKLRVLDLCVNNLTSLKANKFSRLAGLVRLDLRVNEIEVLEKGAFSGLLNLQELSFIFSKMRSLDLAVFGDEPDLVNLSFLNLKKFREKSSHSIISSVDTGILFAHCRHRVGFQAGEYVLRAQGGSQLFDALARDDRIFLISTNESMFTFC